MTLDAAAISPTPHDLVRLLGLVPHPEGGHYRELYRADETVEKAALPPRFQGARSFSTAIYFLLEGAVFSALHTIESDELWHHYEGAALRIVTLASDGTREDFVLGKRYELGERPFACVKRGRIFGSYVDEGVGHALVGCTVAPGFDFADFVMPTRDELLARFPAHAEIVTRLTRT